MKMFLATVALAAAIASPALAQNQRAPAADPPLVPPPSVQQAPAETFGEGVQRPIPPPSVNPPVVRDSEGNRIGNDPDPRVRDELKRDPPNKSQ